MNPWVKICLISISSAVLAVLVLKYLGYKDPAVIAGGIAGGVAGVASAAILKKK